MKPLILIADDDAKHRKLLSDALTAVGYNTVTAENGKEAVELARANRPDLVLLDMQMPVMDGLKALSMLKEDRDMQHIPAIAVTAQAMRDDQERALRAGFDGYLSKPISIAGLRSAVASHLARRTEGDE